jgi:hypothetical protein
MNTRANPIPRSNLNPTQDWQNHYSRLAVDRNVKTVMINNHYCTYGGVLQVSLTLTTNPRNKHIPVVAEPPFLELNYQIVGMRDIWVEYQIVDYNKKNRK